MSVSVLPPSVDFQMSIASRNSASGLFGSTASAMSYHICGVSSPHGPAVVVPSGKLIVEWSATRVHVAPPSAVRQSPRKQPRAVVALTSCSAPQVGCGSIFCTSAYRTCGSLGAIASSILPSLLAVGAHGVTVSPSGGLHGARPAGATGQPLGGRAPAAPAGQPP